MTKVAMVTRGSPDMLADIVADGLFRLLGRDQVHLVSGITGSEDVMKSQFHKGYEFPNSIDFLDTEALIVSTRSGMEDVEHWQGRTGRRAVAFLDGEDDAVIRGALVARSRVYFKREVLPGKSYHERVRPLPFGAIPEELSQEGLREGVFCKWRENDPVRGIISGILNERSIDAARDLWKKDRYNEGLAGALIGVSARGVGWDTYRYWETPYWGAALLAQRPGIVIPGDFEDGREAVFWSTPDEFRARLGELLENRPRTEGIALAGRKAALERHLSTHRAKTVLEVLL
jgi:hypothetical protein